MLAEAGYQGTLKWTDAKDDVNWQVTVRLGKRRALNKKNTAYRLVDEIERLKPGVRINVEHPFRVIKWQFWDVKLQDPGTEKNAAQVLTLFALSNQWLTSKPLRVLDEQVRLKAANAA